MSHATSSHGSDKGAAFAGLIGGAIFIACVVYGLVVWTNNRHASHEEAAEGEHASVPIVVERQLA
jgi:Ca2+/Na+ antiporter